MSTRHHYYSDQWQVVEERVGAATTADRRFVWGQRGVDDLVLRERPGASERLYALDDPQNITAITNTAGAVQERYGYDGIGTPSSPGDIVAIATKYEQARQAVDLALLLIDMKSLASAPENLVDLLGQIDAAKTIAEAANDLAKEQQQNNCVLENSPTPSSDNETVANNETITTSAHSSQIRYCH